MYTNLHCYTKRILLCLIIHILFLYTAYSQIVGGLQARRFEQTLQLPSSAANFVYQAQNGIIWLGTKGGVSRYDGYNVQTFRSNITNPNLLSSNNVKTMAETTDYYLFGTNKGLNVLDKNTFKTRKLPFADINNVEIRSIIIDNSGYIWVGTYRTIVRITPDLSHCEDMSRTGIPRTSVNQIYADKSGNIWVMLWEKGLHKFDPKRQKFIQYPRIGERDNPFRMLQNADGTYIISTWGNGMYIMDQRGNISKLHNEPKYNDILACVFGLVHSNQKGLIWMIERNTLIMAKLNGNSLDIIERKDIDYLAHKQFNTIYKDNAGNVWISTMDDSFFRLSADKGAFSYLPLGSSMYFNNARPYITAVLNTANGIWYAVSNYGIGFCSNDGTEHTFIPKQDANELFQLKDIIYIAQPSFLPQNHVWMLLAYQNKIYEIEQTTSKLNIYKTINIGTPGLPQILFEDSKGNLWLSTNIGIAVRQRRQQQFHTVKQLAYDDICSIVEDSHGYVWMASRTHGLTRIKTDLRGRGGSLSIIEKKTFCSSNSILSTDHTEALAFDNKNDKLWVGIAEGAIYSYDPKTERFEDHSRMLEGGIRGDIVNLTPDTHGHLWISTTSGIVRYDVVHNSLNIYSSGDIGVNDFAKNAFTTNPKTGNLMFAGRGGAVWFKTNWHTTSKMQQPIVSDLKVGGISVYTGLEDNAYSIDNKNKTIQLGSDAQNIEIDFTVCEYGQYRPVFAYMIEGIDHTWNYCGERRASANYSNLPSGTHKLLIRYTDSNGQWSDNITAYNIYKQPHLWETWWAYTIYVLLGFAMIYYTISSTRQRIRERQRKQIDRIERQKEAELVQTKLRYFTNVSHDFLTPITVISCIIDDIRTTSDAFNPQLGSIRANLNRLRLLIQQVLDFRKLENGKMTLAVSEGNLSEFVHNICHNYFEPLTNKKNIKFGISTPNDKTIHGQFDANKVEKIIINLLSNAFKYTNEGKINVELREISKDNKRFAVVDIADTGSGIAQKDLAHIFDRFYTARASRTDSNGVGLSLVKEIAELHHAEISVKSEVGKGSVFSLTLPLDKSSYLPNELADKNEASNLLELHDDPTEIPANEPSPTADKQRILIVEDNDELLTLMQRIFSRYHTVLTATNGREGLDFARSEQPDIIVSDVMMPVMDGLQMCRELKADAETSHIPVILLTARTTPEDRVDCYEAGADGYIAKPFELNVLKARIESFLRLRRKRQQEYRADDNIAPTQLQMSALDKAFMDKAIKEIENHIDNEKYDIGQMAEAVCMSKSTLYRKIKSLTDMSPVEFLRSMRLKKSHRMITEQLDTSISEIASACGFSTLRYFSKCFKEEYGVAPSELRKNK